MKAHILLRVSTDQQAKAGTIAAQRPPVRQLALRLGAAPADIIEYREEAVSGAAPLDERDVLRRLLANAQEGDLVCAYDLSRLTRSDDWEARYMVLGRLRSAQLRPATVEDGEIDLHSIAGRITTHIRAEIAAEERKKIRARTMNGKIEAARTGRKPQGVTPYGLRYDKSTREWSIVEGAAVVVREIMGRIIAGEATGHIARDFERRKVGIPARKGASGTWTARRVWHLATQATYKGEWKFNGHVISVPAIVDAETWARAEAALQLAGKRGLSRTQHVYLLDDGLGRCGLCGAPLRIQWGARSGDVPYYVCARRLGEKACDLPWWRVSEADGLVWGEVRKTLERPDLVEEALRARMTDSNVDGGLASKDIAAGEARLAHLATLRGMFVRQAAKGNLPEKELDRELDRIAREGRLVEQTVAAARAAAEQARAAVVEIGSVRSWLVAVRKEADNADDAERRRICRALAPSVVIAEKQIQIRLKLRELAGSELAGSTC